MRRHPTGSTQPDPRLPYTTLFRSWDVCHQTYPHNILTGRRDAIHTVKHACGVAPFPKREESEYDTFGVGHSSTSISAALGKAIANARAGKDRKSTRLNSSH